MTSRFGPITRKEARALKRETLDNTFQDFNGYERDMTPALMIALSMKSQDIEQTMSPDPSTEDLENRRASNKWSDEIELETTSQPDNDEQGGYSIMQIYSPPGTVPHETILVLTWSGTDESN